jgi:serine/threonine protein kinase
MQAWRLGSYELLRPLGEGGMAQVYLARDIRLGREVAVKVLDQRLAERPGFRERFLREARVAAALDHPNIVPLYDFGDSDEMLYLVMPYVSGGSIQDMLHRSPFPVSEVATYGSQMADALDYAHQRNVIHRDVKPANMLLHADGRVLLSDFGLAKIINPSSRPSAPRGHPDAGTPEYMAPEQIEGRSDERSDIYALGVVLYLLLTAHLPFTGSSSSLVMEGHLYRLPEQPRLLNPVISPAMQAVVLRALAKHPDDRYQRASELGAALLGAMVAGDAPSVSFISQPSHPPISSGPMTGPMTGPMAGPMTGPMAGPMTGPMMGPMTPRVSLGGAGWEPPVISSAPRGAQTGPRVSGGPVPRISPGPLPPLRDTYSDAAVARSNRYATQGPPPPRASGAAPRISFAPSGATGPGPAISQASGRFSRPVPVYPTSQTPGPAPRPVNPTRVVQPHTLPARPAEQSAVDRAPMPRTTGPAQTRISVRSGMSQRLWVAVIVALLIAAIAAGFLWRTLQDQTTPQAPGSRYGPAILDVRDGAQPGMARFISSSARSPQAFALGRTRRSLLLGWSA